MKNTAFIGEYTDKIKGFFQGILPYLRLKKNYLILALLILFILIIGYKIKKKIDLKRWAKSNFMDLKKIKALDGFQFEDYVEEQLCLLGFKVKATPKSGDYGIDLIVSDKFAVQLKNYSSPVGITAVQEVYTGAAYYQRLPVLLVSNYYTGPAIHLCESLGIEMIDLDDIKNWGNPYYKRKYDHSVGFYEEIRGKLINGSRRKGGY